MHDDLFCRMVQKEFKIAMTTPSTHITSWISVALMGSLGIILAMLGSPGWSFAWGMIALLHLWPLLTPEKE